VPIVQSIREAGDYGRPAKKEVLLSNCFEEITRNVVQEVVEK
jgi:ATP-binding protein involved in chromosome partitioning